MSTDVTTPGYIRLPVCSGATAKAAWTTPSRANSSDPNYPCVALQGVTDCQLDNIFGQTSDASPTVSDCQTIVNNIQGTSGTWTTTLDRTRQLVSAGTCAFSVEEDNGESKSIRGRLGESRPRILLSCEACADLKSHG